MTLEKLIEYEKYSEQLEIELHQKKLEWLNSLLNNKDEAVKTLIPPNPPAPSSTNSNKKIHEVQTGTIRRFEKDTKQLKIHFELDDGKTHTQCYQFSKGGVFYLLNNFLEPMQVTALDKNSTVRDFANFNYNAYSGVRVEIERHKESKNDPFWSLDKCTPVIEPIDW